MSTDVWGLIELEDVGLSLNEKIHLSSKIIIIASENEIGIDLGERIPDYVNGLYRKIENRNLYIPFNLTNSPIQANVDALFAGDKAIIYAGATREDIGESLDSRMSKLQRLFERMLLLPPIKRLILYINASFGDGETEEIKAKDFKSKILKLYEENHNLPPEVTFVLTR